jgi:IPT/TIG domain
LPRPAGSRSPVKLDLWIAAALFIADLLLLGPWVIMDFSDQPWNNGYLYTGIARMFRDRTSMWNALQYGGSPFHYLYPPVFPSLVALVPFLSIGHAFHLISGIGYALAPACLYLFARQLFGSRLLAIFAALSYAVFPSPIYLLAKVRALAHPYAYAPWGYLALVGYDEAPHALALPLTLGALTAAWRNRWTLASVLAGSVFLTSWPGMIGLGFAIPGLVLARWRDLGVKPALASVLGFIGVAYGISAFWMTPAYFVSSKLFNSMVFRHTMLAAPWSGVTWMILAAALIILGLSLWRRIPSPVALAAVWFALSGLVVVGYLLAGNYLLPLPHRYTLEFCAAFALLMAGLLSLAPRRAQAVAAAVLIAAGTAVSFRFITHSWRLEPRSEDPRATPLYQTAMWLQRHANGARVLASGELDSNLNLWTDVAQVGGSGQDPTNFLIFAAERQVAMGCEPDSERVAELWLRALNVPWFVVHGATSQDYFHWYSDPDKFAAMPIAWDDGAGDVVHRVPNFEAQEAAVVDLDGLAKLPRLASTADLKFLEAYVNWAAGKHPVAIHRISPGEASLDVNLGPREAVLLKANYDAGWRVSGASSSGATLGSDPIGFQLIRAAPGPRHIALGFGASWDTWLGRAITLVTILLLLARVNKVTIAAVAVLPAIAAWAVLVSTVPQTARIAEEAFDRIQPPLINAQGIVDAASFQQPPLESGRLVSIYGLNFGTPSDTVRVFIGDRAVPYESRGPNQVNLRWPGDAPRLAPVSLEVNGCRGNAFAVLTR